jgi:hypothetical protein
MGEADSLYIHLARQAYCPKNIKLLAGIITGEALRFLNCLNVRAMPMFRRIAIWIPNQKKCLSFVITHSFSPSMNR